jgi:4,5-DOPA dioxygenase extradiol
MIDFAKRMPAVFIGHGTPMNALETNRNTEAWRLFAESIAKPAAVLCVSAHWYTRGIGVTAMERPKTIHDFGGFPKALFDVQYPAIGDPELAKRIQSLLQPLEVQLDHAWGLDHGSWSILVHMFPNADIPVLQLSIDATQPAHYHYEIGKRLNALRDENVLVLGSGNVVHNLGLLQRAENASFEWATASNDQIRLLLQNRNHAMLIDYGTLTSASRSIPTPEHYLPMLYILGTQQPEDSLTVLTDGVELGSISMLSFSVG